MLLFRIYALFFLVCIILFTLAEQRLKEISNQILNSDFMTLAKNKKKRKLIKTLIKYNIPLFNIVLFIFSFYCIYTLYLAINEKDIFANEHNQIIMIILSVSALGFAYCLLIQNIDFLPSLKSNDKSIKKIILKEISFVADKLSGVFVVIYFIILICITCIPIVQLGIYESTSTIEIMALRDKFSTNIYGTFFIGTSPEMDYVYIPKNENNEVNIQILNSEDGKVTIHPKDVGKPRIVVTRKIEKLGSIFFPYEDEIETSFDIYIPNDIIYQYNIDLE